MRRAKTGFRAMLLGLAIGCAAVPVDRSEPSSDQGHYVAGSVDVVSRRVQNLVQSLGITAVATPEGEGIRLRCTTKTNGHFSLVMTKSATPNGERTRIQLDWEDGADEMLGIRILAGLGTLEGV